MKVCIQAGHKGMISGATGAPGERDWTTKIVPMVAKLLKDKGVEVYEADAFANNDKKVTGTDWDLFLSVHYDADIYNDRGGFVDYPDKSVDMVWEKSKALADALSEHYFKTTSIPNKPKRSNANTKFYYMWSSLSAKTPCVIIECGVGWRKPDDYNILRNYDLIAKALADGILKGLNLYTEDSSDCEKLLEYEKNEKERYKKEARELRVTVTKLEKENTELKKELDKCAKEKEQLIAINLQLETERNDFANKYEVEKANRQEDLNQYILREKELNKQIDLLVAEVDKLKVNVDALIQKNNELLSQQQQDLCSYSLKDLIKAIIKCSR